MDIQQLGWSPSTPDASDPASGELDRQDFLKLLISQMSQQDPLNPADASTFMSQLAQFSNLEQLVRANTKLDTLTMAQTASTSTAVASLIGHRVTAAGDGLRLEAEGTAEVGYELSGPAKEVEVSILDEGGTVVRTYRFSDLEAGRQEFQWDGRDENGNRLEAGDYTFSIQAKDEQGQAVESLGHLTGLVTGVTYEKGYPELLMGDRHVALGDVIEVL
jgi:flagellar basal-body rod modification protein FlgD